MEDIKAKVKTMLVSKDRNRKGCIGPGIIYLLKEIESTGSLNKAAKELNMSYSKAWTMLRDAEKLLSYPLVERNRGKVGASLTEKAYRLIEIFEKLNKELEEKANDILRALDF